MRKLASVLAIAAALMWTQAAFGQPMYNPSAPAQPAPYGSTRVLSPWLNLLRGGDPAVNYYLGVYPDMQRRNLMSQPPLMLQTMPTYSSMLDDRSDVEVLERQLPPTGHTAGYLIYNAYFNIPNQRGGFIPYNPRPMMGQQQQQQLPVIR